MTGVFLFFFGGLLGLVILVAIAARSMKNDALRQEKKRELEDQERQGTDDG